MLHESHFDSATAKPEIILTEKENKICDLLKKVCIYIKEKTPNQPQIELRIAGGWVRDKLLGKECHDIDIAVDKLTGFEFANYVNEYLKKNGQMTQTIAKIAQNPEKSKHLETSKTHIYEQEIDFANLRSEEYNENSRIPSKIDFGTPLEDARRRDITINSLFYNIISEKVEDYTKMGIHDLWNKTIRTPISPNITFRDDPLRVLRVIRFASRFNFKLDKNIKESLADQEIKTDFKLKISKERIGDEIYKIIANNTGQVIAIELIVSNGWYFSVFEPPAELNSNILDGIKPEISTNLSKNMAEFISNSKEALGIEFQASELVALYIACYIFPYFSQQIERNGKKLSAISAIGRESLKFANQDIEKCEILHLHYKKLEKILDDTDSSANVPSRVHIGLLIREIGPLWKLVNVFNAVVKMTESKINVKEALEVYKRFDKIVMGYDLEKAYEFKYLVNGKEISQLLKIRPGPEIKSYLEKVMAWQLEFTNATKKECTEYVLSLQNE
ncbi:hypothetical protein BB561_002791 [Smittium simulii]|uniref:Poly A polymerase head domain-containing protein n=1 Tax=Smittium simulii TaxID=133385 RepID=A0A2T9YP92_9FUNG|nr:hypothetical protein BB561_002791 [Smittium simulii]